MTGVASSARRRHPSMRCPLPPAALRHRVATELEVSGAPHADVAAAILEVRGRSGLEVLAFADRAGVDVELLRRAEAGETPRDQLPGALRRMVPLAPDV